MRPSWLLLAVAALLAAATPAAAAEGGSVSAVPAQLVLDQEGSGTVALLNESGDAVSLSSLSVVDAKGTKVPGDPVKSPPTAIVGGGRVQITVELPNPPAGAELVIVSKDPDGTTAVLRVPVKPTYAVTEWTVRRAAPDDDETNIWELPIANECGQLGLSGGAIVGILQAGSRSVTITGKCTSPGMKSVALTAGSTKWAGQTYAGKIDLGAASGGPIVDLKLVTTTQWWIVAGLLVTGIAVALAVAYWTTGTGREVSNLTRQTYLIDNLVWKENPRSVDKLFAHAAESLQLRPEVQRWTIRDDVNNRTRKLRSDLRKDRRADALKSVEDELVDLDATIRSWPQAANSLGELEHLWSRLAELPEYKRRVKAKTFGRTGPKLTLDEIKEVSECAREAAIMAAIWPADAISAAIARAQTLPANHEAVASLESARAQFRTAIDRTQAWAALPDFWEADKQLRAAASGEAKLAGEEAPAAGAGFVSGLFTPAAGVDPAATARYLAFWITAIDYAVIVVILLAGLLAGMQALYVTKPFGGWWDAAAALAWGLTAGALAVPLSVALTRWIQPAPAAVLES
ncbi:hypothetical protein ACXC9Q_29870 [Kribbella sp. CWNU-51]